MQPSVASIALYISPKFLYLFFRFFNIKFRPKFFIFFRRPLLLVSYPIFSFFLYLCHLAVDYLRLSHKITTLVSSSRYQRITVARLFIVRPFGVSPNTWDQIVLGRRANVLPTSVQGTCYGSVRRTVWVTLDHFWWVKVG